MTTVQLQAWGDRPSLRMLRRFSAALDPGEQAVNEKADAVISLLQASSLVAAVTASSLQTNLAVRLANSPEQPVALVLANWVSLWSC